jgi:hypothetical protein
MSSDSGQEHPARLDNQVKSLDITMSGMQYSSGGME